MQALNKNYEILLIFDKGSTTNKINRESGFTVQQRKDEIKADSRI